MKDNSRKYGIIIGALLVIIALMTVGYAAIAARLTINESKNSKWEIDTISIVKDEKLSTNGVNEISNPIAIGTSLTFNVNFSNPGEKIVYNVTVKNEGTIDAIYRETTGLNEINSYEPNDIIYTIERLDKEGNQATGEVDLLSGKTNTFRVTIEYDNSNTNTQIATNATKSGTINLIYNQK